MECEVSTGAAFGMLEGQVRKERRVRGKEGEKEKEKSRSSKSSQGAEVRTVAFDFCSPNTAKNMLSDLELHFEIHFNTFQMYFNTFPQHTSVSLVTS